MLRFGTGMSLLVAVALTAGSQQQPPIFRAGTQTVPLFATLVGSVAAGETVETVAEEYPLTVEQVRSALSYAAHGAAHLPPAVRQAS